MAWEIFFFFSSRNETFFLLLVLFQNESSVNHQTLLSALNYTHPPELRRYFSNIRTKFGYYRQNQEGERVNSPVKHQYFHNVFTVVVLRKVIISALKI